jgi:undecaprenyl diphosphate synthase
MHVAIIMDGNGRWALQQQLNRIAGHVQGVIATKQIIIYASKHAITHLSLFAFGRDNWQRPTDEVSGLMQLVLQSIIAEIAEIHTNNIVIRFIGDKTMLSAPLITTIQQAETLTSDNTGLLLYIYFNYSGQYDIQQAAQQLCRQENSKKSDNTMLSLAEYLLTAGIPDPELLIRTGGEQRLSNFMLWQLAYSELYFSNTLWPDFNPVEFGNILSWYSLRERRFGRTSNQLTKNIKSGIQDC